MKFPGIRPPVRALFAAFAAAQLAGCATNSANYYAMDDQECLARVMYFESIRSSEDGMLAVGTVVMNRLESGRYPGSVCGVIGQRNQFAPGALTKPLTEGRSAALARKVAGDVLSGKRHPGLAKNVMFFHTHGYHFPYTNMRYVLVAGGNIFYYKDNSRTASADALAASQRLAYAGNVGSRTVGPFSGDVAAPTQVALSEQVPAPPITQEAPTPEPAAPQAAGPETDAPTPRAQPVDDAPTASSEPPAAEPPTQ